MSGDQSGEVSWFVSPLPLSQLCQPEHTKLFNKKLLSNLEYEISKQKTIFYHHGNYFFYALYLIQTLMSVDSESSNILKETYSQKLLFILSMYDVLLPPSLKGLRNLFFED